MFRLDNWYEIGFVCALAWFVAINLIRGWKSRDIQGLAGDIYQDFRERYIGLIAVSLLMIFVMLPLQMIVLSGVWPVAVPYSIWLLSKEVRTRTRKSFRTVH